MNNRRLISFGLIILVLIIILFFAKQCSDSSKKRKRVEADSLNHPIDTVKGSQGKPSIRVKPPVIPKDTTDSTAIDPNNFSKARIEVKTFNSAIGWGYDVYVNNKLFLHQPNVPAVPGNSGFETEAAAQKTGELTAFKLRQNINPPSVSMEELDSIGVLR